MPDPLTPLFADMIDGSVTRSIRRLMVDVMGGEVVRDGDVGLPTVNGYAYYRYRTGAMARMTARLPVALWALAGRRGARFRGDRRAGGSTRTRATSASPRTRRRATPPRCPRRS